VSYLRNVLYFRQNGYLTGGKFNKMVVKNSNNAVLVITLFIISFCCLNSSVERSCAEPTVTISGYKVSGYAVFNDIQGKFTYTAKVSEDVVYVEFYLGDVLQLTSTAYLTLGLLIH